MRLSIKVIVGAAIVAASVAAATFGAGAPAAAADRTLQVQGTEVLADLSARKRTAKGQRGTSLRVFRLSRNAVAPPNPNRPYYRPVPHFYPFAQNRGYF
jgi:hypothetical protein